MARSRREFIRTSLATGALLTMPEPRRASAAQDSGPGAASRPLEILFLGGTGFLGPATVEYALERGHTVTLFNRGRTDPKIFTELEQLRGDRDPEKGDGLTAIKEQLDAGRRWDAVIDPSGQFPRLVKASAELLAPTAKHYVYISSISAYADHSIRRADETAPEATMDDPTLETMGPSYEYYGPLKVLCEKAAEAAMPGKTSNIRPGLIVGPRDWSDRFSYWPVRVSHGGEVLSPGSPDDTTQIIDVRDLGAFIVRCCEERIAGLFNATGPVHPMTMAEMLHGCKAVTGGSAHFTWVPADFLAEHGVRPWMDMPAWVPADGESAGLMDVDCGRAIKAGLTTRPLAETVRATLDWFHTLPERRQAALGPQAVATTAENARDETVLRRRAGLSGKRESEVLEAWHARVPAMESASG